MDLPHLQNGRACGEPEEKDAIVYFLLVGDTLPKLRDCETVIEEERVTMFVDKVKVRSFVRQTNDQ